jgi:SAM-dependent methyltransferase
MAYRRRVRTVFEWLQPEDGDHILDGGCGQGFYLHFMRCVCQARLVGVELDWAVLEKARAALTSERNVELVNGDICTLPFATASFDKVIMSEVLEHVADDVAALQAGARVVKPGGLLVATVPNANYPFWWDPVNKTLESLFGIHVRQGVFAGIWANHVRLYDEERLCTVVAEAGLDIIAVRRFTHACFPFSHNIVYGFGKAALEAGLLPRNIAVAADRHSVAGDRGGALNPINIGLRLFEWFDRTNVMEEPAGRATVNLCVLARKS